MNRVALITGGTRGIGRGICEALKEAGYSVAANYAGNDDAAAEFTKETDIPAYKFSVADYAACQDGTAAVAADLGDIGVLVNNAGITSIGRADLLDATEENWDALMEINLKGPFFLSQLAARWMSEQTESADERRPKIINISSISAHAVSTNRGDYCVAKAGLGMVTKLFAARLADHGINVYEIGPGVIASDMTAPVREKYDKLIADGLAPIRRWGEPSDVGKAVVALALDYFPFTTGEVFNVDGGFNVRKL